MSKNQGSVESGHKKKKCEKRCMTLNEPLLKQGECSRFMYRRSKIDTSDMTKYFHKDSERNMWEHLSSNHELKL